MDLLRLHLVGFANYQNVEIDLRSLHVVGLIGQNGSGKSSFIESIVWAFYGITPKGSRKEADNHVRTGQNECLVTVEFFLNHQYRVTRSWNKEQRKGSLSLYILDGDEWIPRGKGSADVQSEIEKILRMDYQTFTASVVALQGQSDLFTKCTDQERKQILASILGLDVWETIQKRAADNVKDLTKVDLKRISDSITQIDSDVKFENDVSINLKNDKSALQKIEKNLTEKRHRLEELQRAISGYDALATEKDLVEKQLNNANNDFDRERQRHSDQIAKREQYIAETKTSIKTCQAEIDGYKEVLDNREIYISNIKTIEELQKVMKLYPPVLEELKMVQQQINKIENLNRVPCDAAIQGLCPFLDGVCRSYYDLYKEQEDELFSKKLTFEVTEKTLTDLQNERSWEIELAHADKFFKYNQETMTGFQQHLDRLEKELAEWRLSLELVFDSYKKKTEGLPDRLVLLIEQLGEGYQEKADECKELLREIPYLEGQANSLRLKIGASEQKLATISEKKAERDKLRDEYTKVCHQLNLHKIVERAANKKKGVPALVVENAIPEIEGFANDILERVTQGRFGIRLETQIDSKTTDSVQEVLKIFVLDRGILRPYQTYSGAQKFILDLSLRVAISKFLAYRSGTEIKILVIDEGFGSLDDENMPKVMEAIMEIARDFNKLFIVTHIKGMKDLLPQKIYFQDTLEGAKLTIVQ